MVEVEVGAGIWGNNLALPCKAEDTSTLPHVHGDDVQCSQQPRSQK